MSDADLRLLRRAASRLGLELGAVAPIVGDASRRVFFRAAVPGGSVVAAVYPAGAEEQLARDERVHDWGWGRGLPIPRPLGHTDRVAFSADLGDGDLERVLRRRGDGVLDAALDTMAAFQACTLTGLETPPFDAPFFRRELAVFEEYAWVSAGPVPPAVAGFLDDLATALAGHPYRLVHRDFHANNLFLVGNVVRAVDYQDMRGGPDTYDAVSLLRERAAGELLASDAAWSARAAARLGWEAGWHRRYLECAAQRGLKVVGTFLRLAAGGRQEYLAWLPRVRRLARDAVLALDAPRALVDVLSGG